MIINKELDSVREYLETERLRLSGISTLSLAHRERNEYDITAERTSEIERYFANKKRTVEQLHEIQHALEKLANGTYGFCDNCGKPIPDARIKALPQTTLYLLCKTQSQK
jgi:RNA polymerase-binding transcription factor DksA